MGEYQIFDADQWLKHQGNGHEAGEFRCQEIDPEDIGIAPQRDADIPLPYIDIARDPIPPRDWAVRDRIPAGNVTLLSGEGSIGKSLLLLQAAAASVVGRDWIGTMPASGPAMYLSCEDDDNEVCRRLDPIAKLYGVSRLDLKNAGLHVLDYVGRDAALGFVDRRERILPTPLFERLKREAKRIRPQLLILDTASDVFVGKENDRAQTRQFVTLLRGLAIESAAAVILVGHPSLTGIATDTGLSGNTAWHNSVRARGYFKKAEGFEPEEGVRVLEWRKNNYGPISEKIVLRWRNGVFVPEPRLGSLEQMAAERMVDELFVDLLRRFTKQGRNVSDKRSPTYAPAVFAGEPEAKERKIYKDAFVGAMTRLFAANKITVAKEGSASRIRTRIVEVSL
jgi:RecA-family ATPase